MPKHLHPEAPGFKGEMFRQGMGVRKGNNMGRMRAPMSQVISTAQKRTGGGRMASLTKPPTKRPMMGVGQ